MSWTLVTGVLGFAVIGFDPFSVLILAAALGAGARRVALLAFAVGTMLSTVVVGTVLGRSVHHVTRLVVRDTHHVPDGWRLAVELVLAVGLAGWATYRWRRRKDPPDPAKPPRGLSPRSLFLAGLLWGLASVTDPGYVGAVVLVAREDSHLVVASGLLLWFLVAQSPMVLTVAALAAGRDARAVRRVVGVTESIVTAMRPIVTVALAVLALALLADAASYVLGHHFLVKIR